VTNRQDDWTNTEKDENDATYGHGGVWSRLEPTRPSAEIGLWGVDNVQLRHEDRRVTVPHNISDLTIVIESRSRVGSQSASLTGESFLPVLLRGHDTTPARVTPIHVETEDGHQIELHTPR